MALASASRSDRLQMQILEMVFARLNQGLTAMPSFVRTATVSIHTRKYRFIEFFIPGIIAMMVMTESHHTHHADRLDSVEHSVPVHARGHRHHGHAAGGLWCV